MMRRTRSSASPPTRRSSRRRSPRATAYDAQLREVAAARRREARSSSRSRCRTSRPRATCSARSGSGRRCRRLRLARGRPALAYDRDATFEQAMRLHGSSTGRTATSRSRRRSPGWRRSRTASPGKSINVTLIFSLAALRGGCRGLHPRARAARRRRRRPGKVISVASFFVSRVDTEADKRLEAVGRTDLQGSSRSRTRSSPTSIPRDVRRRRAGSSSPARARGRSGASGRRRRPRTRPTGHDLRVRADRAGRRQHDAARDDRGVPGSRRRRPARSPPGSTRRGSSSSTSRPPVSTTTTSPTRSRRRACRSSPTRSTSCWRASKRSAARSLTAAWPRRMTNPPARRVSGSGDGRSPVCSRSSARPAT